MAIPQEARQNASARLESMGMGNAGAPPMMGPGPEAADPEQELAGLVAQVQPPELGQAIMAACQKVAQRAPGSETTSEELQEEPAVNT